MHGLTATCLQGEVYILYTLEPHLQVSLGMEALISKSGWTMFNALGQKLTVYK